MPELGSLGSVRGVLSNEHPYREYMQDRVVGSLKRDRPRSSGHLELSLFNSHTSSPLGLSAVASPSVNT